MISISSCQKSKSPPSPNEQLIIFLALFLPLVKVSVLQVKMAAVSQLQHVQILMVELKIRHECN